MPTVVLLDVSLSMSRYTSEDNTSLIELAGASVSNFFEALSQRCKLEHSALVVFSSLYEVVVKFTRDYAALKKACFSLVTYDKTMLETALQGIDDLVTENWGAFVPINLILVTDGSVGIGEGCLADSLATINTRQPENRFPIPFKFPCRLSVVCLADVKYAPRSYYEQLIALNCEKGELLIPDKLTTDSVDKCFTQILNTHYTHYEGTLKCGHFESKIALTPAPNFDNTFSAIANQYRHSSEQTDLRKLKLGTSLTIIGFLDLQCFANPAFMSRHLVVPVQDNENTSGTAKVKDSPSFVPSFCVLLHASLKQEKMGAVVKFSESLYGILSSWSDSKKKSNLILSIFEPGPLSVPWLGSLKSLGPAYELPTNPYQQDAKEGTEESPFPVNTSLRRSYHTNSNAVWIKSSGLQSDIQKLLRYAKKLPEKQSAFFKEVNKIRRAGVAYGFHELLTGIADALETEADGLRTEVKVQLKHVAEGLRNAPKREINKNIVAINIFRKKGSE